jgi:hypothetical protein
MTLILLIVLAIPFLDRVLEFYVRAGKAAYRRLSPYISPYTKYTFEVRKK